MIDKPFIPGENSGEQQELPREIEAKIVNLGDPQQFLERLNALGAEPIGERRLLSDRSFRKSDMLENNSEVPFSLEEINNRDKLKEMFRFLGIEIVSETEDGELIVRTSKGAKTRMVRLRQDTGKMLFTVKETRKNKEGIDNRVELETELPEDSSIIELLNSVGYIVKSQKEKYRTTFALDGCKVELNEGPAGTPWAEIEADSEEKVLEIAQRLGYDQTDLKGMSDTDYYKLKNPELTQEELDYMTFARMQSKREAEPSE
ncbi:MAG: hypothetical protein WCT33_02015 [Patescibacteria group bacterium]